MPFNNKQDALDFLKRKSSLRGDLGRGGESAAMQVPSQVEDTTTGLRDAAPPSQSLTSQPVAGPADAPSESPVGYVPTPEAALDRKVLRGFIDEYAQAAKPLDAKALIAKRQEIMGRASAEQEKQLRPFDDTLANLSQQIADVQKSKEAAANRADWAQVAEMFTNALTQYAAGTYGMKHGVDLSGVRFSAVPWQEKLRNQLTLLNDKIDLLKSGRAGIESAKQSAARGIEKSAQEEFDIEKQSAQEQSRSERELAKMRLTAAVDVYKSQVGKMQQAAQQAKAATASGSKDALRMVDGEYKNVGGKLQGINQAMGILEGMENGSIEDKPATRKQLGDALAKAGLSADQLQDQMKSKAFFGLFDSEDKTAGIKYLQALKGQAEGAFQQLDQAHDQLFQKVTGSARPEGLKFRFGGEQPAAAPAPTSGPQPGAVVDGYKFKGGDPANQANWEKVS